MPSMLDSTVIPITSSGSVTVANLFFSSPRTFCQMLLPAKKSNFHFIVRFHNRGRTNRLAFVCLM